MKLDHCAAHTGSADLGMSCYRIRHDDGKIATPAEIWAAMVPRQFEIGGEMTEWQPIETAPKDGTRVLLFFPVFGTAPRQEFGCWDQQPYHKKPNPYWSGDCERTYGGLWYRSNPPTHWMPPPAPPLPSNVEVEAPDTAPRC